MNEEEQSRFAMNVKWFNQFFSGLRQLYQIVVDTLPTGFFPEGFVLSSGNFYFPRQNFAPTIPPYYVLMVRGKQVALQIVTILDPDQFGKSDFFAAQPSVVIVLHSQVDNFNSVEVYALRVIKNRGLEIAQRTYGSVQGKINAKLPAEFFSFQVSFDKFSADRNPHDAVLKHIVDPITTHLERNSLHI